ncbi:hypothetical protein Pst134EA_022356 [Puccinia striiformis f. sp. tritici]|uniref:hypothetical protein n=1 Tax=Puccinia striiformis f. sp. tritici TaxID=168172 RepID=UPI002007EA8D|nr:hypothetical protein Pst134EA_022356 [Puccinia striiformis f. sp. tritici]KAH9454864.1 hypothetical protein Pst134EA_022356 [Puccinia striiformis f. sp. tritici]
MVYSACDHCRRRRQLLPLPPLLVGSPQRTSVGASSARPITLDSPPPPITIPSSPATNRRLASPSTSLYFAVSSARLPLSPLSGSSSPVVASGRRRPRALQGHSTDLSGARIQLPHLTVDTRPRSPSSCSALLTGTGLPISLSGPLNRPWRPNLALMAVGSSESSACLFPGSPLSLRSLHSVGDSPSPDSSRINFAVSRSWRRTFSPPPDGADPLQQALEDFAGENEGVWGELQRIVPSPDRSRLQELRDLQSELLSSLEQRLQQQLLAAPPNVSTSTPTPEALHPSCNSLSFCFSHCCLISFSRTSSM